ncbi:hypothetical protein LguiB_010543 [Lonicera macranthoides]
MKTKWLSFLIIALTIALPIYACESSTSMVSNLVLVKEEKVLKNADDIVDGSTGENEGQRYEKGVHKLLMDNNNINHAQKGVYGGSDINHRPANTHSGGFSSPPKPFSVLSIIIGFAASFFIVSFF